MANLVENEGLRDEPAVIRLARLWTMLGSRETALALIEDNLLLHGEETLSGWESWMHIASQEPHLPLSELLQRRPFTIAAVQEKSPFVEDVRWCLDELRQTGELRINCGASRDYVDHIGKRWSHDRFFDGGLANGDFAPTLAPGADTQIYLPGRWWFFPDHFSSPGYRIPLPNETYEVTLHFCWIHAFPQRSELRKVDVLCEGLTILADLDFGEAGLGVPNVKTFVTEVLDGALDVVFRVQYRCELSALMIRRLTIDSAEGAGKRQGDAK